MFKVDIKFISILLYFFLFVDQSLSNEILINSLKDNNKLIFIRHAYAPGNGDPEGFNLQDCNTQRNLNDEGIEYARKMGNFFLENDVPIDKVFSSEWCRCQETAIYAFGQYKVFKALNSFYDTNIKTAI